MVTSPRPPLPDESTPLPGALPHRTGALPIAAWFGQLTPGLALALAVLMTACVAVGDLLTGAEMVFTLLYLGPVAFATWFVGARAGAALSAASAAASVATDLATRTTPLPAAILTWNLLVQLGVLLAQVMLLDAFRSRLEAESQLARTDPLTDIPNRRGFLEAAQLEVERARRHRRPLTVAYVDVDDFKGVNDRLGHAGGDLLLATVAAALRGSTRAVDGVARLGGDEFGLLLPETDGPTAEALLARVRATLAAAAREQGFEVTFSAGAVCFVEPPGSVDELLRRADDLMYECKRQGKNRIRFAQVGGERARLRG
ncbi:GGDEF domain-containing protein [Anaeromyxobacter paludicola]|uniref:diguanylate cyclase n=1 Tax=Anaeromyxobacter paludicola TaxID=2918171 RepID=A0ABN6N810_9BACT|nr:GGDEF domain-containing protein [Anaeromyxobacter paludicola]BDG09334.1 hypothetical protein AMPC_24470 [Anaeromyxobacter paludicola]